MNQNAFFFIYFQISFGTCVDRAWYRLSFTLQTYVVKVEQYGEGEDIDEIRKVTFQPVNALAQKTWFFFADLTTN